MSDPTRQESPSWKAPPRSVSPACAGLQVPSFTSQPHFRQWCQSAGVLGTVLALCSGCPAVPLYPRAGACPEEARQAMALNNLRDRGRLSFTMTGRKDSYQPVTLRSGVVIGVVVPPPCVGTPVCPPNKIDPDTERMLELLPPGTLLYGRLWTDTGDDDDAILRFDRVRTPDNREFPVCIAAGWDGALWVDRRPEPGAITVESNWGIRAAQVVFSWPDPCAPGGGLKCKAP